jgi:hypothetical protein
MKKLLLAAVAAFTMTTGARAEWNDEFTDCTVGGVTRHVTHRECTAMVQSGNEIVYCNAGGNLSGTMPRWQCGDLLKWLQQHQDAYRQTLCEAQLGRDACDRQVHPPMMSRP